MSRISKKFVKLGTASDEINARDLEGNFTPSNYTPAQVASEGNTKISAHLKGIDTYLGSISGLPYTTVTANSATLAVNNGYVINNNSVQVDLALPSTSAVGDRIEIVGKGSAGWLVSQASGQQIINVNEQTLAGVDGKLMSLDSRSAIVLVCVTANTTWAVLSVNGRLSDGKTFGYLAGGSNNGPASALNDVFKLDFGTETGADITATLGVAREEIYGTASSLKGYFACGISSGPTFQAGIDALTFATDSISTLSDSLDSARAGGSGVQSASNGYYLGGYTSGPTFIDTIAKLNFSTETVADIGAVLTEAVADGAPVSSSIKGYRMGGIHSGESAVIDALTFSAETVAALSATLDASSYYGAGVQSASKGYCCGGLDAGNALSAIQDLDFSNETSVTITATLPADRAFAGGTSATTIGYIAGGYPDSSISTDTIYALDFSAETTSTLTETLDQVTREPAGVSI